jgi:hypothetical protein
VTDWTNDLLTPNKRAVLDMMAKAGGLRSHLGAHADIQAQFRFERSIFLRSRKGPRKKSLYTLCRHLMYACLPKLVCDRCPTPIRTVSVQESMLSIDEVLVSRVTFDLLSQKRVLALLFASGIMRIKVKYSGKLIKIRWPHAEQNLTGENMSVVDRRDSVNGPIWERYLQWSTRLVKNGNQNVIEPFLTLGLVNEKIVGTIGGLACSLSYSLSLSLSQSLTLSLA